MALKTYLPNTVISSTDHNSDHQGLADGTNDTDHNSLQKTRDESLFDHVISGGAITDPGASLTQTTTALVAVIDGYRSTLSATAKTYSVSKDTYVDVLRTGTSFSYVYTEVANNAASPALAANSLRLAIVTTNGTEITNSNQGEETQLIPIASSIPYAVTDSLGNLIRPLDATRRLLGYRQITSSATTSGTGNTATNLQVPVIVPSGRKIRITAYAHRFSNSGANNSNARIFDGAGVGGTQLQQWGIDPYAANASVPCNMEYETTPSAASKTYTLGIQAGVGTATFAAAATSPAFIRVELD